MFSVKGELTSKCLFQFSIQRFMLKNYKGELFSMSCLGIMVVDASTPLRRNCTSNQNSACFDQNVQNIVLIVNSRTAWCTKILPRTTIFEILR